MTKRRLLLGCAALAIFGYDGKSQTPLCTQVNPTNCPTTGIAAGPPTLKVFVTETAAMFPIVLATAAPLPQPHTILSAQVTPANDVFITSDPRTCPVSGACSFNNLATGKAFADSMLKPFPNGAGLKSLDFNLWMGPIFESSQYASLCSTTGACFTPSGSAVAWYTNTLTGFYDPLFTYISAAYPGTLIRFSPMFTPDVTTLCGITVGAPTVPQVENCTGPVEAAMAARWHIDYFTVMHEPCGVLAEELGTSPACAFTVADWNTWMEFLAPIVRANSTNPDILLGVGLLVQEDGGPPYTCPSATNYWCSCTTTLVATVDFCGMDLYPQEGDPTSYPGELDTATVEIARTIAASLEAWVNESAAMRYGPVSGNGENATYYGCGYVQWLSAGTTVSWFQAVPGKWAPSQQLTGFSYFDSASFLFVTTDPLNNRCSNSDGYLPLAMQHAGQITQYGLAYGRVASGQTGSLQGTGKIENGKLE